MGKRVVVVGAVALGPKVACRVKRVDPLSDVLLLDKDDLISYGGCGIPYYIGGDVDNMEALRSTSAHVIRDNNYFENVKGLRVMTRTEAIAIDRPNKKIKVRNLVNNEEKEIDYDKLVLATGATPIIPPLPGIDLPGVFAISNLHQAKDVKDLVAKGEVEKAVVIGGGAIGIEMAESLADLWGVETTLVEMMDQLLPTALGKDMALPVKNHMEKNGVTVLLEERVNKILGDSQNGVQGIETSTSTIPCDLVILAVGVRPDSTMARKAGLATGMYGGILVDQCMRTSDPDIYAGGDCVEIPHLVSGHFLPMPLGSLANRQGRVIGTNIAGGSERFKGTVGTFCLKIFELGIARGGLTERQARDAGFDPVHTVVVQADRAHFYPDMQLMYIKLIADRKTKRVLGIEAAGSQIDSVKSRVDAVSVLLGQGVGIDEIATLEVAYAPPFASAMDIVNNAANSLDNIIEGYQVPIDVIDFLREFKENNAIVLDVRSSVQAAPFIEKYGDRWLNIDQGELKSRLSEIPGDKSLILICGSGPRSYETQLFLRSQGVLNDTKNVQGGIGMTLFSDPDFAPGDYS